MNFEWITQEELDHRFPLWDQPDVLQIVGGFYRNENNKLRSPYLWTNSSYGNLDCVSVSIKAYEQIYNEHPIVNRAKNEQYLIERLND